MFGLRHECGIRAANVISKVNTNETQKKLCRMVLEWRDKKHGDVEEAVQGDLMTQEVLRACGLYKFCALEY